MKERFSEIYTRSGTLYHAGWEFMTEHALPPGSPYFTRAELIKAIMDKTGCAESKAFSAAGVLLSPSSVSHDQSASRPGQILSELGRGDCRGNFSSQGHKYAVIPVPVYGKNESGKKVRVDTKYKVELREVILPSRRRDTLLTDQYLDDCISALHNLEAILPTWASNEVSQETDSEQETSSETSEEEVTA